MACPRKTARVVRRERRYGFGSRARRAALGAEPGRSHAVGTLLARRAGSLGALSHPKNARTGRPDFRCGRELRLLLAHACLRAWRALPGACLRAKWANLL